MRPEIFEKLLAELNSSCCESVASSFDEVIVLENSGNNPTNVVRWLDLLQISSKYIRDMYHAHPLVVGIYQDRF